MNCVTFVGYSPADDLDSGQCNVIYTLNYEEHGGHLAVSSLNWNCTGSVLAASYPLFIQ